MSSSRFVKADTVPSSLTGPYASVLTGVSRGLQDLFPPVARACAAHEPARADEREAVAPVLRNRQPAEQRPG